MSTPAQKANLARIRDNQRRSRARKREYLQELEQRLRTCELQGIEASAEVQMAARRVAEENVQLRELLQKQGVSKDYIDHYLQNTMGTHPSSELSPVGVGAAQGFPGANPPPGPSVQSLQQLLAPRRPTGLEPNAPFPMPGQATRETSITSASTSTSSLWEPQTQGVPTAYSHHSGVNLPPGAMGGPSQYSTPVYSSESTPRVDSFTSQQTPQSPQHQQQGAFAGQQMPGELQSTPVAYNDPNATFNPNPRDYGPPGGYC